MLLRDFLNEFELDYAQAPSRMKNFRFEKLKNNKVIIIGEGNDTFTRAIIYSFLNLNDQNKLNIEVNLVPISEVDKKIYIADLLNRKDFKITNLESLLSVILLFVLAYAIKKLKIVWENTQD